MNENLNTSQINLNTQTMAHPGQPEIFDPRRYAIDKTFDTLKEGARKFNDAHPGDLLKIAGGTLAAIGITLLLIK